MNSEDWQKVKELFDAALEIVPKKRKPFLYNAYGDDPRFQDLLRRVGFPQ